ncbi:hypothetical protein [Sulfurovum sp. NBC37-1]|uniref:hypothetical protein n=1 Tax=Sulfurovum sp. (strain NBC37-1) TaxID=387093 RepID=UPI0001587D40|nr:hypothetical protein [Sulfurovum sp. NBC37-1]BAF73180.1 hypothetical protein SUN_2240 [Sulfurovum sp. NBC37-1]
MKKLLMIIAAIAMTSLFVQANETTSTEAANADATKQVTESVSAQHDTDTAATEQAEKTVDEKTTEKH